MLIDRALSYDRRDRIAKIPGSDSQGKTGVHGNRFRAESTNNDLPEPNRIDSLETYKRATRPSERY